MKFIGITGGVGAGKSAILSYLSSQPGVKVMLADDIAHQLMEPGTACYAAIRDEFKNQDIFMEDGSFDRKKLAKVIFEDANKRDSLNKIVHPAVKDYVISVYQSEIKKKELKFLFLEAALLIEEHYDEICDQLWYIYTEESIRRTRLKDSRGYSDEKIDNIFKSQMDEATYRQFCSFVIDNNGDFDKTRKQLDKALNSL